MSEDNAVAEGLLDQGARDIIIAVEPSRSSRRRSLGKSRSSRSLPASSTSTEAARRAAASRRISRRGRSGSTTTRTSSVIATPTRMAPARTGIWAGLAPRKSVKKYEMNATIPSALPRLP